MTRQRNLGIIAHVDAGKTTLTERLLFHAGRIHRIGNVDHGNTTTDTRPEEREKGITINAAAVSCEHRGHALTLVDTPGHADFTIEVERSLRVLDGAVLLLDAVAGVEPQTEKVWRQADRWAVPRIAFVNKLDRAGADLGSALRSIRERLGARPVLLTLPIGMESDFCGLVDLVSLRAMRFDDEGRVVEIEIPGPMREAVAVARGELIEACAEIDETVLAKWLDGLEPSPEELKRALRLATSEGTLLPTLCGSALANRGVPALLDAIVDLLPAPEEGTALIDVETGNERCRTADDALAALCFKVVCDSFGTLAYVRVYAGVLRRGDSVAIGDRRKLRIGRLVRLFADRREAVEEVAAGGIAAIVGADLSTGETLSDPEQTILLESIQVPETVIGLAIEPRRAEDRDRLPEALKRLLTEDPSLALIHDPETGQTMLTGMGQLHLEVSVSRLSSEHRVQVDVGQPRVAYRETITRAVEIAHLHKKQSGGPGEWAKVVLRIEPADPGEGLVFEDRIRGGAIPREYVPAVFKGCRDAATHGVVDGHPVVDVRVILLDGETHANDSSEFAFGKAGRDAFREALRRGAPCLLEPIMRLETTVPTECVGDVMGDLARRGGRVQELLPEGTTARRIVAAVPLAGLFGYAGDLASLSQGRGAHHLELASYEPA